MMGVCWWVVLTKILQGEVGKLRSELLALMERRDQREAALASDLIAYINTLPRSEMQTLTSGVQPEVLEAMETLVYGILKQFGVKEGDRIVLESSDAMKKLLLWQLAIGYNLRELEVIVILFTAGRSFFNVLISASKALCIFAICGVYIFSLASRTIRN
jgi:hypothetical protein